MPQAMVLKGWCHFWNKEYDLAVADFETAVARHDDGEGEVDDAE